jgi:plastocyanin
MKKSTFVIYAMLFLVGMTLHTSLLAVTHNVQVGNYYFSPSSLNVNVGDIVKWVWVQGSHTTTSSTIPSGATSWDAAINNGNQTYEYTVTIAGTYNYVCTPHAGMGMVASFVAAGAAPALTVAPSNQNVTATTGSTTFTVTSNISWNASSNQSWCTVTPSGTGNGSIVANYTENVSTTQRVASITVTGSGVSNQVVTVTQAGAAPTLNVSPSSQNVANIEGETTFTVTSNGNWTTTSNAAWCTVTNSGSGNGTITAMFPANPDHVTRTATITVSVTGVSPVLVQVIQDASTVGIPGNNGTVVRIYPNPAKDVVKISLDNISDDNFRLQMVDLTGKIVIDEQVQNQNEITLNISQLPRGYYFAKVILGTEVIVRRMILTE